MKKLLCAVMVAVLAISMSVPAFAATVNTDYGTLNGQTAIFLAGPTYYTYVNGYQDTPRVAPTHRITTSAVNYSTGATVLASKTVSKSNDQFLALGRDCGKVIKVTAYSSHEVLGSKSWGCYSQLTGDGN